MKRLLPLVLMAAALTGCANAQPTAPSPAKNRASVDHPGSIPILLGLDPVRQYLQLTPVQCGLLDALRSDYKSQAQNITAIGMDGQDAALRSGWDLEDLRARFNARSLAVLNPSQQDGLRQIERQMLGGSLLTSPSEQKLLGLTADQQSSIAAISKADQANAASINAQFNAGKISSFRRDINLRRNQQQTSKQMLATLTDKQRKNWLVLSGQKTGLPKIKDPDAATKSLFEGY
jgi:hypothetical protein